MHKKGQKDLATNSEYDGSFYHLSNILQAAFDVTLTFSSYHRFSCKALLSLIPQARSMLVIRCIVCAIYLPCGHIYRLGRFLTKCQSVAPTQ